MPSERYVAVGLLTQRDLDVLGSGFRRAFPLDKVDAFTSLLTAIDQADGTGTIFPSTGDGGSGRR